MNSKTVGEVIAVRRLFLVNEPSREIVVRMGKPIPIPGTIEGNYSCPFQIVGIGSEMVTEAGGVDAFQALELALKMIGAKLAYLNRQHNSQLRWECDANGGLGFPPPEN